MPGQIPEAKPEGFSEVPQSLVPAQPEIKFTPEQYRADLKTREDELRADLTKAHADEKAILQAQIDELTRQQENPEDAFEAFKTRIAELEALLGNAETEDEQAAKAALEAGDLMKADDIFAKIVETQKLNIKKAADAEYACGEIAKQQIRWRDAATHYGEAARLDPKFRNLHAAHNYALLSGNYPKAAELGPSMVEKARAEFGEASAEHSLALDRRATFLQNTGDYSAAEPLFRQALKTKEEVYGRDHSEYATSLNNLASLLQDKGDLDGAEPLYREALRIDEITIGKEHPDYAIRLNNLAALLEATGRYDEAEPLYREAMRIDEITIGKEHPDYAIDLNNLASLLRAKGDLAGAEPLLEQAIEILSKSLGEDHPNTKLYRENLRILREEMANSPQNPDPEK